MTWPLVTGSKLTTSLQPGLSERVAYILYISAMLSRQGLVLVENVDGALALGGIDHQYQVGRVNVRTHICISRLINYLKGLGDIYPCDIYPWRHIPMRHLPIGDIYP